MVQFIVRQWQNILLGSFILLIVLLLVFKSWILSPNLGEALAAPTGVEVRAVTVPLNEEDPNQRTAGKLRYVAGWALTADNRRFGGFSGLQIEAGGNLVAINDLGNWLTAKVDLPAIARGQLLLSDVNFGPYGNRSEGDREDKEAFDAEGLVRFGDRFLVSFEQDHRVRITAPGQLDAPWPPAAAIDFGTLAPNGGLESLTWTKDSDLLTFAERGLDVYGRLKGWLVSGAGASLLYLKPPKNFAPTDAATLPDGDVILLLRRYSVLDGVAIKLVRIKAGDIKPGAVLVGEELAHLQPPLAVDNLEALDVMAMRDGRIRLFIMSDDNLRQSQRTLLLVFDLSA